MLFADENARQNSQDDLTDPMTKYTLTVFVPTNQYAPMILSFGTKEDFLTWLNIIRRGGYFREATTY